MGVGWAVFRNYSEHAKEIKGDVTDYPRFFLMPDTSHSESDDEGNNVIYLPHQDEHVDHEVELVIKLANRIKDLIFNIYGDPLSKSYQGSKNLKIHGKK